MASVSSSVKWVFTMFALPTSQCGCVDEKRHQMKKVLDKHKGDYEDYDDCICQGPLEKHVHT